MKENKQEPYTPPQMKMVEIKAKKVLCQSNHSATNDGYNSDDYEW